MSACSSARTVARADWGDPGHRACFCRGEAATEHRQPPEHDLLVGAQEAIASSRSSTPACAGVRERRRWVAPDGRARRSERPRWQPRPRAARGSARAPPRARLQAGGPRRPRRCVGSRQARRRYRAVTLDEAGAVDEQAHRVRLGATRSAQEHRVPARTSFAQPRRSPSAAYGSSRGCSTSGAASRMLAELGTRHVHVLAVVEHEQCSAVRQMTCDRLDRRLVLRRAQSQRACRCGGDALGRRAVGQALERHDPRPVGKRRQVLRCELERESRLPAATLAHERAICPPAISRDSASRSLLRPTNCVWGCRQIVRMPIQHVASASASSPPPAAQVEHLPHGWCRAAEPLDVQLAHRTFRQQPLGGMRRFG